MSPPPETATMTTADPPDPSEADRPMTRVVARAVAGEPGAFERLVGRWDGEVLNLAYRLTGNLEDARDVRQSAFTKVYCALPTFDGRSRFSTWLFRIVVNCCRDHQRRRRSILRRLRVRATAPDVTDLRDGSVDDAPDQRAEERELHDQVIDAVMQLPVELREVLVLRHYHEQRVAEIGRLLDIPATTARARLERALEQVRGILERPPHSRQI